MCDTNPDNRLATIEAKLEHVMGLLENRLSTQEISEDEALGTFGRLLRAHMNSLADSLHWLSDLVDNNVHPDHQHVIGESLDTLIESVRDGFQELISKVHEMHGEFGETQNSQYDPLWSSTAQIEGLAAQLTQQAGSLAELTSTVGSHIETLRQINLSAETEVEAQGQGQQSVRVTPVATRPTAASPAPAAPMHAGPMADDLAAANARIAELETKLAEAEKERSRAVEDRDSMASEVGHWAAEWEKMRNRNDEIVDGLEKQVELEQTLGKQVEIGQRKIRALFDEVQSLKGNIRVMCRIRPGGPSIPTEELVDFGPQEPGERGDHWGKMSVQVERKSLTGAKVMESKTFGFERIFSPEATNADVFTEVKDFVETAMAGKAACVFSYGQTGSGKTYTLAHKSPSGQDSSNNGMIHQTIALMFDVAASEEGIAEYSIEVSVIEIYLDNVYDLVQEPAEGQKVAIRMDQAEYIPINSAAEADTLLDNATKIRTTSSTNYNSDSSRSHLILTFRIRRGALTGTQKGQFTTGRLNLIDLAGSERSASQKLGGQQLQEGIAINQSLTSLNRAITALGRGTQISYDTALIRALRPALSRGCQTLMLVMVSPLKRDVTVSLQTLEKGYEATKALLAPPSRPSKIAATPAPPAGKIRNGLPSPVSRGSTPGRLAPKGSVPVRSRGGKSLN
ncbi:P-loop containing nucleoside triphosphate hydrolase protein [Biscogniauxia sp. FL1348]|nr:P-loop containing nucleoside triphosphate hydrolase protein [Biscogniauxia sp. FL1348]